MFFFQFKEQFDELQNNFEDVLAYGHYGVIVALVKTCQRLDCGQKPVKQVNNLPNADNLRKLMAKREITNI